MYGWEKTRSFPEGFLDKYIKVVQSSLKSYGVQTEENATRYQKKRRRACGRQTEAARAQESADFVGYVEFVELL